MPRSHQRNNKPWVSWEDTIECRNIPALRGRACRQCLGPLTGRQTAYCSKACESTFSADHFWGEARVKALKSARKDSWRHCCARCDQPTERPEVNHINPVRGGKRNGTCKNHASNLEVLCHSCHVLVTEEQFRPEKAQARGAQVALV